MDDLDNLKFESHYQIGCTAEEVSAVIKKINEECDFLDSNFELKLNLELAAREMLANAVEHGAASISVGSNNLDKLRILVSLKVKNKKIFFTVIDPGTGFNWEEHNLSEFPLMEEKGRGLKMIKAVSDQIIFNSSGNKITAVFEL